MATVALLAHIFLPSWQTQDIDETDEEPSEGSSLRPTAVRNEDQTVEYVFRSSLRCFCFDFYYYSIYVLVNFAISTFCMVLWFQFDPLPQTSMEPKVLLTLYFGSANHFIIMAFSLSYGILLSACVISFFIRYSTYFLPVKANQNIETEYNTSQRIVLPVDQDDAAPETSTNSTMVMWLVLLCSVLLSAFALSKGVTQWMQSVDRMQSIKDSIQIQNPNLFVGDANVAGFPVENDENWCDLKDGGDYQHAHLAFKVTVEWDSSWGCGSHVNKY